MAISRLGIAVAGAAHESNVIVEEHTSGLPTASGESEGLKEPHVEEEQGELVCEVGVIDTQKMIDEVIKGITEELNIVEDKAAEESEYHIIHLEDSEAKKHDKKDAASPQSNLNDTDTNRHDSPSPVHGVKNGESKGNEQQKDGIDGLDWKEFGNLLEWNTQKVGGWEVPNVSQFGPSQHRRESLGTTRKGTADTPMKNTTGGPHGNMASSTPRAHPTTTTKAHLFVEPMVITRGSQTMDKFLVNRMSQTDHMFTVDQQLQTDSILEVHMVNRLCQTESLYHVNNYVQTEDSTWWLNHMRSKALAMVPTRGAPQPKPSSEDDVLPNVVGAEGLDGKEDGLKSHKGPTEEVPEEDLGVPQGGFLIDERIIQLWINHLGMPVEDVVHLECWEGKIHLTERTTARVDKYVEVLELRHAALLADSGDLITKLGVTGYDNKGGWEEVLRRVTALQDSATRNSKFIRDLLSRLGVSSDGLDEASCFSRALVAIVDLQRLDSTSPSM